ncbi:MAG: type II toxin-antitoxin system VapC family toxin [Acidobacteriota bacterium]|nr:type II toxin-antitoxin system VapC family toxin [Acidobacteriota bacterium]
MILLDTNVISEPVKPRPEPQVLAWINSQVIEALHLPSPALAEWLTGVECLPAGRRKREMEALIHDLLNELIGARVLPFDRQAAEEHAKLVARAAARGKPVSFADAQIAAIASVHGFTVASRDTEPFVAMDIPVINPWTAS